MSSTIASTTEPIRNTAAYKTLAETLVDALDDSGTAKHAGFEEKEARRKRRALRLAKAGQSGRIKQRVAANAECVSYHFRDMYNNILTRIIEPDKHSSSTPTHRVKSAGNK